MALGLGLTDLAVVLGVVAAPVQTPFSLLIVPLVLGSILLGPRTLPWLVLWTMAMLTVALASQEEIASRIVGAASVQVAVGLIVLVTGFRRARLGVAGLRGESMFVDLRDRILNQGGIPTLPDDWSVTMSLHSAGGTAFAGDFVVASRSADGRQLQVVVADVSGKGVEAGTRSLLLSGAFGGILDATPGEGFLPAANHYLVRQEWEEGFATAVHLSVDLVTGAYEVRGAGHPPAVHRVAGTGRWQVHESRGPLLGLVAGAGFPAVVGVLERGDALLLYTDGMVEEPRRDIDLGIDRMMGQAEHELRGTVEGAADRLVARLGSPDDDRALVLVHRR